MRQLARPEAVLTPKEMDRAQDFVDLFAEQLDRLALNAANPQVAEILGARVAAAELWAFGRAADVASFREFHVEKASTSRTGRAEEFADTEHRYRLRTAALDALGQVDAMLEATRLHAMQRDKPRNREKVT